MSTQIAKSELDLLVANNLAYTNPAVEGMEGAVDDTPRTGLRATLSRWFKAVADYRQRRAVLDELNMLSDRELADVGLSRTELHKVFSPVLANRA